MDKGSPDKTLLNLTQNTSVESGEIVKERVRVTEQELEKYITNNEPEYIPSGNPDIIINIWIAILINNKFSYKEILSCIQYLNKKYFKPVLEEEKITQLVNYRFNMIGFEINKDSKKIFYANIFNNDIIETGYRISMLNLKFYRTNTRTKNQNYWVGTDNPIFDHSILRFFNDVEELKSRSFIHIRNVADFLNDWVNRNTLPYPRVVLRGTAFVFEKIKQRHIALSTFRGRLKQFAMNKSELRRVCVMCRVNPLPLKSDILWAKDYCSSQCKSADDDLFG